MESKVIQLKRLEIWRELHDDDIDVALSKVLPHLKSNLSQDELAKVQKLLKNLRSNVNTKLRAKTYNVRSFLKANANWLDTNFTVPSTFLPPLLPTPEYSSASFEEWKRFSSMGVNNSGKMSSSDVVNCIFCLQEVTEGTTHPIGEHEVKCLALVLNFESNALHTGAVLAKAFHHGLLCPRCQFKLGEAESIVEDWELLRARLKSIAEELRQILGFRLPTVPTALNPHCLPKGNGIQSQKRKFNRRRSLRNLKTVDPLLIDSGNDNGYAGWDFCQDSEASPFPNGGLSDEWKPAIDEYNLEDFNADIPFDENDEDDEKPIKKRRKKRKKCSEVETDPNLEPELSTGCGVAEFPKADGGNYTDLLYKSGLCGRTFTSPQLAILLEEYEQNKEFYRKYRFDDPSIEIRRALETIAFEVNKAEGPVKSSKICWERLQLIIQDELLEEASTYIVHCPNGDVRLKYCHLMLQKCENLEHKVSTRSISQAKPRKPEKKLIGRPLSASAQHYFPPEGKLEKCAFHRCDYKSTDPDRLRGHYNSKHLNDTYPFKCSVQDCGKSFMTYTRFNAHRGRHAGFIPFSCNFCDKKFYQNLSLTRHKFQCHENGPAEFQCHVCPRQFFNYSRMSEHIKSAHNEKTFKCSITGCEAVFAFKFRLQRHCWVKHPLEYPNLIPPTIICPQCGKICYGERNFNMHNNRKHLGLSRPVKKLEKKYACSYEGCRYKGITPGHLRHHRMNVHETHERKVCTFEGCGATFKNENGRHGHVRRHHDSSYEGRDLSKFECHICGHRLHGTAALNNHIAVRHTPGNKRDFVCEKCDRGFPTKKYLDRHKQMYPNCEPKKPPGPNAVQCEICLTYCSNYNGLKRHYLLVHQKNAEKSWICGWCGRGWPIKMYLTRHESRCVNNPKNQGRKYTKPQFERYSGYHKGTEIQSLESVSQIPIQSVPPPILKQNDVGESHLLPIPVANKTIFNPIYILSSSSASFQGIQKANKPSSMKSEANKSNTSVE